MRLLNVHTFEFVNFLGDDVPNYSIASHRWIQDEATIKDISKKRNTHTGGYKKVEGFCSYVQKANALYRETHPQLCCDYLWIDTCCIDQKSSLEVDTAIRSMFQWYNKSVICYAYLADVEPESAGKDACEASFRESVWFSRGWTLQELLAPRTVVFLTKNWEVIGHKCTSKDHKDGEECPGAGQRLNGMISEITGIPEVVLCDYPASKKLSIEERMSWSAQRKTTRQEDSVYCLLGIFEIHMPVMYGEGEFAQIRLRNEIDKKMEAWDKGQKASVQSSYNTVAPCAVTKTTSHVPTVSEAAHGDLPAPIVEGGSDAGDADTVMTESTDFGPDHAKAGPSQAVIDSQFPSEDNLARGIGGLNVQGGRSSGLTFAPGPKRTPGGAAQNDDDFVPNKPSRTTTFNDWRSPGFNPGQAVRTSSWTGQHEDIAEEPSSAAPPAASRSAPPVPPQKVERPPVPQQQPPRPPVPRTQPQKPPIVPEQIAEETAEEHLPPPPDYDSIWESGPSQPRNDIPSQKSPSVPSYPPSQAARTQSHDSFTHAPPARSATWNPPSNNISPPLHQQSWDSAPQEYAMPAINQTHYAASVAPPSTISDKTNSDNLVLSARANRHLEHAIAREERKEGRREKRRERRAKRHGGTSSSGGTNTVAGGDDDFDDDDDFYDVEDDMLSTTGSSMSYATAPADTSSRSYSVPSTSSTIPAQQQHMADVVTDARRDARKRFFAGGGVSSSASNSASNINVAAPSTTSPQQQQGPFSAPARSNTSTSSSSGLASLADSLPSSLRLTRGALHMLDAATKSSSSSSGAAGGSAAVSPGAGAPPPASEYGGTTISSVAPGSRLASKPAGIMGRRELRQVMRDNASAAGSESGGKAKKLSPRERLMAAVANSRGG
jgi:hypothetical protein